jgi:2-keto-4-pentenoate hydratase/2-oxohepta-3-ene-1,7-dioic acid hydratase in catechol pathway
LRKDAVGHKLFDKADDVAGGEIMKLVSFSAAGRSSYGAVMGDGIIDLRRRLGDRYPTLRAAIAGDVLGRFTSEVKDAAPDAALSQVTLLPPITDPDKIICAGRNYRAHAAEAGGPPPENPQVFLRLVNTLVPHGQPMVCPRISDKFDYEGELALVIGKPGRHIAKQDALSHIFGYACFNDGSIRDIQRDHSITAGKNFYATGGFGPWIVTADEIPDPTRLHLVTRLNGREVQHTGIDDLIFDIPTLISYCSDWTPLVAGDVISTGTPEGVGFARKPPLWMKPGDVVEVEIDGGVGVLRNPIVAEN